MQIIIAFAKTIRRVEIMTSSKGLICIAVLVLLAFVYPAATVSDSDNNGAATHAITVEDNTDNAPLPDFDGDGTIGIGDFLIFVDVFGSRQGDEKYEARYDLDGNGEIGISDFLVFIQDFGKDVPPSPVVAIPDANLRTAIEAALGKERGAPITRAEMATLTRIDAPNKGIRNLTGLEHATNLQRLGLGRVRVNDELVNSNDISNLSPLSNLTNLTYLSLTSNSISDISALSNLTNLTRMNLWRNSISDISALSNLTNLTVLDLIQNSISDISALSNLTKLDWLRLTSNSISDISALSNLTNLTELSLGNNSISDISALSNLTNLTGLVLGMNSISDISPLVANTGLGSGDTVDLRRNPLSSASINTHIPALQRRGVTVEFDSSGGSGSGGGGDSGGACTAGLVVNPGGSCTYKGFTFSVSSSGTGSIAFFSAGNSIDARGSTINGVRWNFYASRNSDSNSWTIHTAE